MVRTPGSHPGNRSSTLRGGARILLRNRWVSPDELLGFDFAPADIPIVKSLVDGAEIV